MKTLYQSSLVLIGALAFAGAAYAQVPSTNGTSDSNDNTGIGAAALGGPATSNPGLYNTAVGYQALQKNTTNGNANTAVGAAALEANTSGNNNSAVGEVALETNSTGSYNTAFGAGALTASSTTNGNTAVGYVALYVNSSGTANTAIGSGALSNSKEGNDNTAVGNDSELYALSSNDNTAVGFQALEGDQVSGGTGSFNTAIGVNALYSYSTGNDNVASGFQALYSNTTADYNTASGYGALYSNNGNSNTASGYEVMYANTSGIDNTATGVHALATNTSGSNNIAEGYHAGYNLTTGSNNIDIGSPGAAGESGVIRIGTISGTTSTQSATYIAGIYGKTSSDGLPLLINSNGLLGTTSSSARFKTAIEPMGSSTEKLGQLRPVKFQYKADLEGTERYGLIAEEVATIYPELVVRDANGRIDGVRYDELAPMLLNEVQKQQQKIAAQDAKINQLQQQFAMLQAALVKLQSKDELVAQR